jgi:hypothetical protein
MYFPQSAACSAPNSANPPTQADIMRVARSMGKMEGQVRRARQAFYCLFYRADLNTNGWPLAKFGGVPSSTVTGCPAPASTCAALGATGDGVNLTGMTCWPSIAVTEPAPAPIAPNSPAAYPQPPAPTFPPLTTQAHSAAAKALVAQAAAATVAPKPMPAQTPQTPQPAATLPIQSAPRATLPAIAPPAMFGPGATNWPPQQQPQQPQQPAQGPTLPSSSPWTHFNYTAASSQIVNKPQPVGTVIPGKVIGVGDFDMCSFVTGLIASLGVAAAAMYVFRQAQKPGFLDGI